jgi:hypothetical protein
MRFIVSFSAFICILVLTNCTNAPSAHDQDNPFDSTGTNWNPPSVVASPAQQIISVGDTAVIAAQGIDNGSIARYFWTVDGVSQSLITDTLRLPTTSQGTRIVCVYVRDNDGVRSKVDSVLVLGKDKAPLLTAPVNGTQLTNNGPTLTWTEGYYNNHYKVLLDTVTPPRNIGAATITGTSFTPITGLVFSKNYYWQVIGYNNSGLEVSSQVWGFKTGGKPAIPTDGLVVYYPFNGNAKDESGNVSPNDGVINGAALTSDRFGKASSAFSFNGIGNSINIAHRSNLNSEKITLSAWTLKQSTDNQWHAFLSKMGSNDCQYSMSYKGDSVYVAGHKTDGTYYFITGYPIKQKGWHHILAIMENLVGCKLYVDGVLVSASSSMSGAWNYSGVSGLAIGKDAQNNNYFQGSLDDIRIYNRILTTSEISDIFHEGGYIPPLATPALSAYGKDSTAITITWNKIDGTTTYVLEKSATATGSFSQIYSGSETTYIHIGLTKDQKVYYRLQAKSSAKLSDWSDTVSAVASLIPTNGLVAYWPFNGNAKDESGNGNMGVSLNTTFSLDRFAKSSAACLFDGNNSYITIPTNQGVNSLDKISICAWVNTSFCGGREVIISNWNDNTNDHSWIFKKHNESDRLQFTLINSNGNPIADLVASTSIPLDKWIFVTATYDGDSVKIYFNGALDAKIQAAGRLWTTTTDLIIGAVPTAGTISEVFSGEIDDIRIYNRALTEQEIQTLYHESGWTGQ